MRFRITHRTQYSYAGSATESFMEARLTPLTDDSQRLLSRQLITIPTANIHSYTDYFGNAAESFSIAQRHRELVLESTCEVETTPQPPPQVTLSITLAEARQLYHGEKLKLFEFLAPSAAIPRGAEIDVLAQKLFKISAPLGTALLGLNKWIKANFHYVTGSTQIDTPVETALKQRTGVCQDFAQVMIAILRAAEIPARYVTGYIETEIQRKASESKRAPALIGASESHAWVEVYLPGGFWWPLDPTNNCVAGERHVKVAVGRDYHDCTPTRGVFKGTQTEQLSVNVLMQRI
jgi:transglutaminase-like putative cysteine protease